MKSLLEVMQVLEAIKEIKDVSVNVNTSGSKMQHETKTVSTEMDGLMRLTEEIAGSYGRNVYWYGIN